VPVSKQSNRVWTLAEQDFHADPFALQAVPYIAHDGKGLKTCQVYPRLFVTKRFDWVEPRGHSLRVIAEKTPTAPENRKPMAIATVRNCSKTCNLRAPIAKRKSISRVPSSKGTPVALIASFDATTLFFRLDLDRAADADEFNQLRETDEPL
jgi:hypothetical protein